MHARRLVFVTLTSSAALGLALFACAGSDPDVPAVASAEAGTENNPDGSVTLPTKPADDAGGSADGGASGTSGSSGASGSSGTSGSSGASGTSGSSGASGTSGSSGASGTSGSSGASGTSGSSGSSGSSSGGGTSGSVPACTFDPASLLSKFAEIRARKPCDATCDPATHCCLDVGSLAGGGSSGGFGGFDAGIGGGSSGSGGLPTACISK